MTKEQRKAYLDLVQSLELHDQVLVSYITNFIETYDGTNHKEFTSLLFGILSLLTTFEETSVKARSFDKLLEIRKEFDSKLEAMEDEFEELQNPLPPTAASDVEETT